MRLEKGRVIIFSVGSGNQFFTTDTAVALRCAENKSILGTRCMQRIPLDFYKIVEDFALL